MATDEARRVPNADEECVEKADSVGVNKFSNDGSFLEMFKKRMEEMNKTKNVKKESENASESAASGSAQVQEQSPVRSVNNTTEAEANSSEPPLKKPNNFPFVRGQILHI